MKRQENDWKGIKGNENLGKGRQWKEKKRKVRKKKGKEGTISKKNGKKGNEMIKCVNLASRGAKCLIPCWGVEGGTILAKQRAPSVCLKRGKGMKRND